MVDLCKLLGIKKLNTTAYHPQCDGMVERFNQTPCYVSMLQPLATSGTTICLVYSGLTAIHPMSLLGRNHLSCCIDLIAGHQHKQLSTPHISSTQPMCLTTGKNLYCLWPQLGSWLLRTFRRFNENTKPSTIRKQRLQITMLVIG